jgi:hypothetical protein
VGIWVVWFGERVFLAVSIIHVWDENLHVFIMHTEFVEILCDILPGKTFVWSAYFDSSETEKKKSLHLSKAVVAKLGLARRRSSAHREARQEPAGTSPTKPQGSVGTHTN